MNWFITADFKGVAMLTIRDHFSDASQSSAEIQIDLNTALGGKLLESASKFARLNALATKASLRESEDVVLKGLRAKSPQEFAALAGTRVRASSRKAASYACHVAGIVAGTQSELLGLLGAQISETNTEVAELVADLSRSTPGGSRRFDHAIRMGFDHANASLEQITQASRQVLDVMETNFIAAAKQFDHAASQARLN